MMQAAGNDFELDDVKKMLEKVTKQNANLREVLLEKEDEMDMLRMAAASEMELKKLRDKCRLAESEQKRAHELLATAKRKLRELSHGAEEGAALKRQIGQLTSRLSEVNAVLSSWAADLVQKCSSNDADDLARELRDSTPGPASLAVAIKRFVELNESRTVNEIVSPAPSKKLEEQLMTSKDTPGPSGAGGGGGGGGASEVDPDDSFDEMHSAPSPTGQTLGRRARSPQDDAYVVQLEADLGRSQSELKRLKAHLLELHDQEEAKEQTALTIEQELSKLRTQCAQLTTQNQSLLKSRDQLQSQLHAVEEELEMVKVAEQNLTVVLETFQDSKEHETSQILQAKTEELVAADEKRLRAEQALRDARQQVQQLTLAQQEAETVRELLLQKTQAYMQLEEDNRMLRATAQDAAQKLQHAQSARELMIDRHLTKKLVLDLFGTHADRLAAMNTLVDLLDFSSDERAAVGMGEGASAWAAILSVVAPPPAAAASVASPAAPKVGGGSEDLYSKRPTSSPPPQQPSTGLSDLWVQYLETTVQKDDLPNAK